MIKAKVLKSKLMLKDDTYSRYQHIDIRAMIVLIRHRQKSGSWDLFDWCYDFLTKGEEVFLSNLLRDLAEQSAKNKTSKQLGTSSD